MSQLMERFEGSCPICSGDVIGNEKYNYFCKRCRMFFQHFHLKKGALSKSYRTEGYIFDR